jgi:hypothetical protein
MFVLIVFLFPNALLAQAVDTTSIFPLNTGDWVEYVAAGSVYPDTLGGPLSGRSSLVREVLGDTVMGNGMTYQKVCWKYMMQSVYTPQPWYQYIRKDAENKIWGWGENGDSLMYDFSQLRLEYAWQVGKSYGGDYFERRIVDTWVGSYFGKTCTFYMVRMSHYNPTFSIVGFETYAEGFGLVWCNKGALVGCSDTSLYIDSQWGSIIGKRRAGDMLAEIDDPRDFYPLHVGDSWYYEEGETSEDYWRAVSIICDTVFSEGFRYYGTLEKLYWHYPIVHLVSEEYFYQRIDSLGNVYSMRYKNAEWVPQRDFKFSLALGDTFLSTKNAAHPFSLIDILAEKRRAQNPNDTLGTWIEFIEPRTSVRCDRYFSKNWGYIRFDGEGNFGRILGACVNGKTWGDTRYLLSVENAVMPHSYTITISNYPNPFNNATIICVQTPKREYAQVRVYNTLGQEVAALFSGFLEVGNTNISWSPQQLSSGIYVMVLVADSQMRTNKLLYIK